MTKFNGQSLQDREGFKTTAWNLILYMCKWRPSLKLSHAEQTIVLHGFKKWQNWVKNQKLVKKGIFKKRWKEWIKKSIGQGKKAMRKGVSSLARPRVWRQHVWSLFLGFFSYPPNKQETNSGSKGHQKFHDQNHFSTWTEQFQEWKLHKKQFKYIKVLL